jgi:hypothetical protein
MEFIKIAYCVTVPLLLIFTLVNHTSFQKCSNNLIAISNILLIGNSIFFAKQLIGGIRLMQSLHIDYTHIFSEQHGLMIRAVLVILLPLLSLHRFFRKNRIFTIVLLVLLYSVFPFSSWNTYDLVIKIAMYLCMLCSGYALLWLLNKLPYQSIAV